MPPGAADLLALDLVGQAAALRAGDASPAELVEAAITRAEAVQPEFGAFATTRFERAREEAVFATAAGPPPGTPFWGVPFALKDLACPVAGEPSHEGLIALARADYRAEVTAHLARRFADAGLIVIGRTNTPELGIMPVTEPVSHGPSRNPWDPTRTPGGSSGGSAVAVAAGVVAAAHASDGGGSIRIPASCCGLVGLKPSRGRVSVGPASGELSRPLSVPFVLARTVRDVAALADVAAGPEVGDPVQAPPPARPFREEVGADPGRLRVGLMTTRPGGAPDVHPDCVAAAEQAARHLEALGHTVEVTHPAALDEPARVEVFMALWASSAAFAIGQWGRVLGRELGEDDMEPLTWALVQIGRAVSATSLLEAVRDMEQWSRRTQQWWADGWDLLCTPTLGEPPLVLGALQHPDDPLAGYRRAAQFVPFTPPFNQTGQPAISLPLHHTAEGLPIGVQLVAAYGREDLLLRVAAQLEAAVPWPGLAPAARR
jgi:amidase